MSRPLRIDTFPIHDELDMLECRLTEIFDAVDYVVAVEADVTHQDSPKPFYVTESLARFDAFKDKLIVVRASGLPTMEQDPDPWARELSQREHVATGLSQIGVSANDILLHGDVDEIPRAMHVRMVNPAPGWFTSFHQSLHCFAVDWLHPDPWFGTVAGRAGSVMALTDNLNPFARMRDKRNRWSQPGSYVEPQPLVESGWHLTWLGGRDAGLKKLGSFCHPEIADRTQVGLEADLYYRDGWHVDGRRQKAVDVDDTFPKWIREGHAPAAWFRPREVTP
jgi:hypothetical protein